MNPANPGAPEPTPTTEATRAGGDAPCQTTTPRVTGLIALALFVLTFAVFWPAVRHPFAAIDDSEYVTDHPFVPQGLRWVGIGLAFVTRHAGNWHPLTTLSHMLDCQLFGLDPAGHHLVNILVHAGSAALVFLLLRRLTGALWRSALVAAFFAVHPLRVESVAWISERKDVLSVFFFLLTLWAYARYAQRRSRSESGDSTFASPPADLDSRPSTLDPRPWSLDYALALFFSLLGLMSKPMLVTLPFVLLLLDYWPLGRFDFRDRRVVVRLLVEKLPFLALSGLVALITMKVQRPAMAEWTVVPLGTRIVNMFVAYGAYLRQTVWPVDLAAVYPYDLAPPLWKVLLGVGLVGVLSALAWLWRRQRPWFVVGWLWFLGTLVPVIGLVQVGIQAHADRYTYLPSIGLWTLIVWTLADWLKIRAPRDVSAEASGPRPVAQTAAPPRRVGLGRAAVAAAALVTLTALCARTRSQLALWENTETLMRHTERVAGSSELVRGALGLYYFESGRLKEAEEQYRLGLELDGRAWPALIGLAHIRAAEGKSDEAERLYRRALAANPCPAHHLVLADFLQEQNRLDEARVHYLQALALAPYHAQARNQLGNVYAKLGNRAAAREQYERALRLNPKAPGVHYNLGNLLALEGDRAGALRCFETALRLDPRFALAHNALGRLRAAEDDNVRAIAHFQQALAAKPDFADARLNLAEALARAGQFNEARAHFESALKLQTNSARAHLGLAGVLLAQQRPADALAHLQQAVAADPNHPEPLNNLAWLRATHPEAALRDGAEAVRLAARAVELTRTNDVEVLDTLAAAFAENGQFDRAIATAENAVRLARQRGLTNWVQELTNRLTLYRQRQPYRQSGRQ